MIVARIRLSIAVALWLACTASRAAGGPIRLLLHITQPPPVLSAWVEHRTVAVGTIINSGPAVTARFDCRIMHESSIQANTKFGSMRTITIPPGTSQFYAEDLVPADALDLHGDAAIAAFRTGMIPAGTYEFCAALLDPLTHRSLTEEVCRTFTVLSYQAPTLLGPMNGEVYTPGARPVMRWTSVSPRPSVEVVYRVRVYEVLGGQTAPTAVRVNRPILDREVITLTQLMWPADVELPRAGYGYVWTVRATDVNGAPFGDPDGLSEPWTFAVKSGGVR